MRDGAGSMGELCACDGDEEHHADSDPRASSSKAHFF